MTDARAPFDWSDVAAGYDRWYAAPEGEMADRLEKAAMGRVLPPATRGETLLDVGCGTGHWSFWFAECGYRVTGVDLARGMLEVAEAKAAGMGRRPGNAAPEIEWTLADARALPFEDGSFAAAAAVATLEFLGDGPDGRGQAEAALAEMARITRRGGRLVLGALNRLAPINRERVADGSEPWDTARLFTPEEVEALLAPYGQPVVKVAAFLPQNPDRLHWAPGLEQVSRLLHRKTGAMIVAAVEIQA